jgi:hypothetical protein
LVRCAAMLVLLAAAPARAQGADCWLLDADALAGARAQGHCLDAFAANPRLPDAKPPETVKPPPLPPARSMAPPKNRDPTRVATARSAGRTAKARRGTRAAGTDFTANFRRDLNAVGRLLDDLLAGRPPPGRTRSKTVSPPAQHHR